MRRFFKIFSVFVVPFLLVTCNVKSDKSTCETEEIGPPAPCEDRSNPLDIINKTDTLKILIEFSDCGEWGGHRELIYLQRDSNFNVFARFKMDTVSCDRIVERNGFGVVDDRTRKTLIDTSMILGIDDKKLFSRFLQRLIELYLKKQVNGNSGTVYHIINTDSTLDFWYLNSGDCQDTYYGDIRKQIFGDVLNIKKE
jgi:hypothetical protein